MLFQATLLIDLVAMATTLWMAFYLLARGFPSVRTLRVVVVSLALSAFFFGAYANIFVQVPGTAAIRAVLLVIGLGGWYSITYRVMSKHNQKRLRWVECGIYAMGTVSILVLLQPGAFIDEEGNALYVAHMNNSLSYMIYGIYQFLVSFGIMFNLLVGDRVGLTSRGKYYLAASVFPVVSVIYGVLSLTGETLAPRIIQDTLAFMGVIILNMAVARHQIWTERRATVQDFPLTTLAVLGLSALYGYVAWIRGIPAQLIAGVVGLTIITLGFYDLTREFLERLRMRNESLFRKQLHQLESKSATEDALKIQLQNGVDLLCQTLQAPGGFVAVRRGDNFTVMASRFSVPIGSEMFSSMVACEDVSHPKADQLSSLAWIAPSFEGQTQVAVVGIEKSASRIEYSTGNLDLLAEVADQVGTIVSMSNVRPRQSKLIRDLVAESQASATELNFVADNMLDSISIHPDADFIKMVEDALRHLPDMITLGQSALAEKLVLQGDSHIDRGKHLQRLLTNSIELLKPSEIRPSEPLPRAWYNYVVLYDAYVEGVQNREIMARLYISEGTFNRTRRNAIRGLARLLVEKTQYAAQADPG
jgi:hypothetical protein